MLTYSKYLPRLRRVVDGSVVAVVVVVVAAATVKQASHQSSIYIIYITIHYTVVSTYLEAFQ